LPDKICEEKRVGSRVIKTLTGRTGPEPEVEANKRANGAVIVHQM
jgi:hypothetical protein